LLVFGQGFCEIYGDHMARYGVYTRKGCLCLETKFERSKEVFKGVEFGTLWYARQETKKGGKGVERLR